MSRKHDDPRGKQKGAQAHAEGQHGERTHERFLEALHEPAPAGREEGEQRDREHSTHHPVDGGHRLVQQRQQFDEAEMESEKNRRNIDIERHDHVRENFQIEGGAESHRVTPRSHINPEEPDAPNPGETPRGNIEPQRVPRT